MALAQPGYGSANQLRMIAKNAMNAVIVAGDSLELIVADGVVDSPLGDLTGQGVMEKILVVRRCANADSANFIGIAASGAAASSAAGTADGGYVEFVISGWPVRAKIITDGTSAIAVGDALVTGANGELTKTVGQTNPVAIALEAVAINTTTIVNVLMREDILRNQ